MAQKEGASLRAVLAAMVVNFSIAVIKCIAGAFSHSSAMLAESVHSLADTGNQILLWLGYRLSQRRPDLLHPFGYGKERYFWSFLVALLMFVIGGIYSIREGILKIAHPHPLRHTAWNLGVLVLSMILEGTAFRMALRGLDAPYRTPRAFWQYVRTTKQPMLIVVLFEDGAALLGLCLALIGIGLARITGDARWDGMASIGIGLLLVGVAYIIARETHSLLIGEGLSSQRYQELLNAIRAVPGVQYVYDLKTLYIGPRDLIVAIEVDLADSLTSVAAVAQQIDRIEQAVRAVVPEARYIYVETERMRRALRPQSDSGGAAPPQS